MVTNSLQMFKDYNIKLDRNWEINRKRIVVFSIVVDRLIGRSLGNRYGRGTGQIWLDNLQCTGSETYIFNCRHNGWAQHDCEHKEDVSIACYRPLPTNGQ